MTPLVHLVKNDGRTYFNSVICILALSMVCAVGCGTHSSSKQENGDKTNSPSEHENDNPASNAPRDTATDSAGLSPSNASETAIERRDPRIDGWSTEVWSDLAAKKLNRIGEWLSAKSQLDESAVASVLVNQGIQSTALVPDTLETIMDGELKIRRGNIPPTPTLLDLRTWVKQLREFGSRINRSGVVHYKFKIIRVTEEKNSIRTVAYFQADDHDSDSSAQVNATWECLWEIYGRDLRLSQLLISNYSEVNGNFPEGRLFNDCTLSVFRHADSFQSQLLKSTNYWRRNIQAALGIDLFGHQGMAIGDANGDGLEDLYICQPGGVVNRLYLQNNDGTVRDVSEKSGTDFLDRSRAAMFIDFDNDSDQDLAVVIDAHVVFLSNNGSGVFTQQMSHYVGTSVTLAAADYDLDSDVDLYVCGYSAPRGGEGAPTPYHDANNGTRNHLLQNNITSQLWQFTDVTEKTGLDQNNSRYSLSASWEDFDNDGDPDLYVANDFGRNNLYRNDDGKFIDIAAEAGVEDLSAGMGVCWGDYNQDGLPDIYVSNMFSSAGNRVAYQRKFRSQDSESSRTQFQRHARGNSLFENVGDGTFRDVSQEAQVMMGRWAWGSLMVDVNNDSHLDILVTNGLATNEDTDDL